MPRARSALDAKPVKLSSGGQPLLLDVTDQGAWWSGVTPEDQAAQASVVAFGDQLDQLFVGLLGGGFHVVGDLAFLALAVSAQFVGVGLHADQVHYA